MNCDEFVETVTAYLESDLEGPALQRFLDHLADCDGCDTYLSQIRETIAALRHRPRPQLSRADRNALLAAFRARPQ
ncbi:anti-sigma factor family protein [Nocardia huaxiensis]|uniref:Zf-HC2 domain-containing protein n=1 Tax=Nocardia huaxiensis TaxID=2755382 RepID=A0A7D6VK06_9NOCA|nr:zf-HC2 domain-containing protein [Nocardia huaxiensis]QLY34737.1 zf-HC2 domain-containing protein [Nocardia huaxiensis]UFT00390.1 zf-HC2 domain-containing protein [Nocardia huaxiensis]